MYENSKGFRVSRLLKTEIGNGLHEAIQLASQCYINPGAGVLSCVPYRDLILKLKFKFQVFRSRQDRKTNSFVCFFGRSYGSAILF